MELIVGGLAATTAIHKGEPDETVQTTQDSPTDTPCRSRAGHLRGGPVDAFEVKVARGGVRVHRSNAPAPDARGAIGLSESKVGWGH